MDSWRQALSVEKENIAALEKKLMYHFKRKSLLRMSLTHRSYAHESSQDNMENNERLEFLGDSVLDLVISHLLMERYPNNSEGFLSKCLASLINEKTLAKMARSMQLGETLILGKGELLTGGRNKDSILADAFEAIIGAIYLDGGLKPAFKVIKKQFLPLIDGNIQFIDYKTQLQEIAQQAHRVIPNYKLLNQSGKDHERVFEISVIINGKVMGRGKGKNKKEAEQRAAKLALDKIAKKPAKKKRRSKSQS